MKNKFIASIITVALSVALIGCGQTASTSSAPTNEPASTTAADSTQETEATSEVETPSEITITSLNADGESVELVVPYNPKRVAILEMSALDTLDNLSLGDRIVGMPKSTEISYLSDYNSNDDIINIGTLKEVDMEALMESQPDIIFIGGRLASQYDALSEIAPVVYFSTDYEIGMFQSIINNITTCATIFGLEDTVDTYIASYKERVAALAKVASGQTTVMGLVTSASLNTMGNESRTAIISNEIGFENLAADVDSTHGNESSFELLLSLNPDYIFILDRDSAIGAEGASLAEEVMNNEIVAQTQAYINGNIVYLTPTAWYLVGGGITGLDIMLSDIETGILK
ncbi:MAG: siderophore ABC transporter substrate-binding protein [Lachnospiraceae bacterium]